MTEENTNPQAQPQGAGAAQPQADATAQQPAQPQQGQYQAAGAQAAPANGYQADNGYAQPPAQPAPQQRKSDSSLTLGQWVVTVLLTMIPVVDIVMLLIWSFDSATAPAKRNFSRAMLIWKVVGIVLSILFAGVFVSMIASLVYGGGGYGMYDDYSSLYDYSSMAVNCMGMMA